MSVIPARFRLNLYQGSTLDETWTFYEDEAQTQPMDLTDYTAELTVRKNFDSVELLNIADVATVDPPADGIVLGDALGTVRVYVTDETMANLNAAAFHAEKDGTLVGVWDFELTDADGRTDRYAQGEVVFSREVTRAG